MHSKLKQYTFPIEMYIKKKLLYNTKQYNHPEQYIGPCSPTVIL